MKYFSFLIVIFSTIYIFAQEESLGVLSTNQAIFKNENNFQRASNATFDSTFIYVLDTLGLPFFDEFSTNKFQQYKVDFLSPNTTFIKEYKLIDPVNSIPISNNQKYTVVPTYTRTFNVAANTHTDVTLPSIMLNIGDQSSYPTVYSQTTVYPPYYIYDTLDYPNPVDTIWINEPDIYQDSAIQFFMKVNDPSKLWADNFVYQNYSFAKNPWSLGVATFDGINEDGRAYSLGSVNPSFADYLTSKPIDLSSHTASDSIYLSFLFQPEGYGDVPEAIDSLVLEFYAEDLQEWFWIWSTRGFSSSEFQVVHKPLLDSKFFKKGFQFRFKNYGNLSGGFDQFHIDYVNLRESSSYNDTLFKDFAFVYPIHSLLKDYTAVPWDHYKNNISGKMSNSVELNIRNGSNIAENNSPAASVEVKYNGILEGTFPVSGASLSNNSLNFAPRTFYSSLHDFSSGYHFDENKIGNHQKFEIKGNIQAIFPNPGINDTTITNQYFANYYSYDDGSAEAAYGPTGTQARLAMRYDSYEEDSLIGIMTQFVESGTNVSNLLFLLTVWDDNNGKPGNVLYQDNTFSPRNPIYNYGLNNYYTYYFEDTVKIAVGKTFYVGWRQFDATRLNIGFDKNNDNSSKTFYSVNNEATWIQSQISGTSMIRPVFSTSMDAELGIYEIEKNDEFHSMIIYPNPSTNIFNIKTNSNNYKGIEVYNLQGLKITNTQDNFIDLSIFPAGIYFVKEIGFESNTYKIIKE